jgi:mannose-6-phosphate isomerase-like protein (cupin superfamily)
LKPWGFEVWLHTEKAPYAFKRIEMNPNFRTSLQYHERKAESNFVLKGKIKFHYQCENQGSKDQVTDTQIGKISLKPFSLVWIPPGTLHRLESLEPTTLFEVSSPEVDDVIRVQDDSRRSHGRIESEHIQ